MISVNQHTSTKEMGMRRTLKPILMTLTTVLALPSALLAHPGHPGHEIMLPAAPVPITGEDGLTAMLVVLGMLTVRAIWRRARA